MTGSINESIIPILIIVGFVVYPFAVIALTMAVIARSHRAGFVLPFATLAAIAGSTFPVWFISMHGFGKIASVTLLGSAVFIFAVAVTGALIGAIVGLFIPKNDPECTGKEDK